MALPVPKAHKIKRTIILTSDDVNHRRHKIETAHGTREELEAKRDLIGLSLDERIALRDLKNLDYLEGR